MGRDLGQKELMFTAANKEKKKDGGIYVLQNRKHKLNSLDMEKCNEESGESDQ